MTEAATQLTTVDNVAHLYRMYAADLSRVREEQRELAAQRDLRPKLDDIEAEITYLLIRSVRPASIVEIGTFHGWSTTWILQALRDNGEGDLHSYDLVDHVRQSVPATLAASRWTFHHGDVRSLAIPAADYLFLDAAHSASFARWYTAHLLPGLAAGTPVSVHDVYHHRAVLPFTEGRVLLRWLRERGIAAFTTSSAHAPDVYERLRQLKGNLRLAAPVHRLAPNPMVFFQAP
jgi:predicted O-methyltransferase YrrM